MSDLSQEMQETLLRDLGSDLERFQRTVQQRPYSNVFVPLTLAELEQLVYITEQIRLKLRLMGAPRIYER